MATVFTAFRRQLVLDASSISIPKILSAFNPNEPGPLKVITDIDYFKLRAIELIKEESEDVRSKFLGDFDSLEVSIATAVYDDPKLNEALFLRMGYSKN